MFVEISSDYCCDITKKFFFFFLSSCSHSVPMVEYSFEFCIQWCPWHFCETVGSTIKQAMFVKFSSDYCCDITKKSFFSFFVSFVVKLAFFWAHRWIELWILHPMVPLVFLWDAWFNHKTDNVRGLFKWLLLWYSEKIFFSFFFFFLVKLASFWPIGWIEHSILHPMVPLAFLWDAWFNHKTGNVREIFKWLLLWYTKKILFFIFFFFCCQAGLILTHWLNRAFNSASNGVLSISVRGFVQP